MLNQEENLKPRDIYLKKLIAFQDKEPVKVITGIRRCGKSKLLLLMQKHLLDSGIDKRQILAMNFESLEYANMDYLSFYSYVKEHIVPGKRMYLFFDELQRIDRWEEAVNSFRVDFDCDVYITGSNAYLLSSEYATYLSGRYVEIKVYPLSFKEFISFHDYRCEKYTAPGGELKTRVKASNGEIVTLADLFDAYMRFGGFPGIADVGLVLDSAMTLLDGVYLTVVVRDILERERRREQRQITDAELLKKIVLFLADNVGNNTSLNSVSNTLVSEKMLENRSIKGKPAVQTIAAYVRALLESYLFYDVKRFDVKGKEYLRTLGKYYIVDIGMRNYLLGFRNRDVGHALENVVYLELLRRGYDVAVGKIDNTEVDFIAANANEKKYIQVTESMLSEDVAARELAPLKRIKDNYPKQILSLYPGMNSSYDGIRSDSLIDWLLSD